MLWGLELWAFRNTEQKLIKEGVAGHPRRDFSEALLGGEEDEVAEEPENALIEHCNIQSYSIIQHDTLP